MTTEYALLFEVELDIDVDFWLRFQFDYNKKEPKVILIL